VIINGLKGYLLKTLLPSGTFHGIFISGSDRIFLNQIYIQGANAQSYGIYSLDSTEVKVLFSYLKNGDLSGIKFENQVNGSIAHCELANFAGLGIVLLNSNRGLIFNCNVYSCGYEGIRIKSSGANRVIGNNVMNNSKTDSTSSGIKILDDSDINLISQNLCSDNQTTKTQKYGIEIADSTCDDNVLLGNLLQGNLTGGYLDNGTNTHFGHNLL